MTRDDDVPLLRSLFRGGVAEDLGVFAEDVGRKAREERRERAFDALGLRLDVLLDPSGGDDGGRGERVTREEGTCGM